VDINKRLNHPQIEIVYKNTFLIGKQRHYMKSVKAPLSIHEVYKRTPKQERERKRKKPAKPKNRRKLKHPNRN
jgi:hypothetical protein